MPADSSQICIIGNLDRRARTRRMVLGLLAAAAALVLLVVTPPGAWRAALFLPIVGASLGLLQAAERT